MKRCPAGTLGKHERLDLPRPIARRLMNEKHCPGCGRRGVELTTERGANQVEDRRRKRWTWVYYLLCARCGAALHRCADEEEITLCGGRCDEAGYRVSRSALAAAEHVIDTKRDRTQHRVEFGILARCRRRVRLGQPPPPPRDRKAA